MLYLILAALMVFAVCIGIIILFYSARVIATVAGYSYRMYSRADRSVQLVIALTLPVIVSAMMITNALY